MSTAALSVLFYSPMCSGETPQLPTLAPALEVEEQILAKEMKTFHFFPHSRPRNRSQAPDSTHPRLLFTTRAIRSSPCSHFPAPSLPPPSSASHVSFLQISALLCLSTQLHLPTSLRLSPFFQRPAHSAPQPPPSPRFPLLLPSSASPLSQARDLCSRLLFSSSLLQKRDNDIVGLP